MNKILFLITLMLSTEFVLAQPASPFFTYRNSTDNQVIINSPDRPLIDPSSQDSSAAELESVIAESFFRRLWSGINSQDDARKQITYSRLNLDDQQALILQQSIEDWMRIVSIDASDRRDQMCSYWNSNSQGSDSFVIADAALELYDSLEPDRVRVEERLQSLIDDIGSKLGEDFVISLMSELDIDYDRRKDLKYTTWATSVRSRNNAIEQLDFTCGGGQ